MSAWNFDSSHSKEYLGKFVPIQNSEIRYFLSNENETKYFLVASKGLGKSLLLKKKAVELQIQLRVLIAIGLRPRSQVSPFCR